MTTIIDLSHLIHAGLQTHPGLPAPTTESYRAATGVGFQVDHVTMVGNTGTYLDSPFHRFADGGDLASVPLTSVADLPTVVLDVRHHRAVDLESLSQLQHEDLTGAAVLLHTGGDRHWGTDAYSAQAPFLTAEGAMWLAERRRRPWSGSTRSTSTTSTTRAGPPTPPARRRRACPRAPHRLGDLPARGTRLHAAPPAWRGVGTWPVRAYALIPGASR